MAGLILAIQKSEADTRARAADCHVMGSLCSCRDCVRPEPVSDHQLLAYLDTLPRAQWAFADTMLYAKFAIPRARAVALAKEWLRKRILMVSRKAGASLAAIVNAPWFPGT